MNRHHPYGGGYDNNNSRRGGGPVGAGPERTPRFAGRGRGRGRGGGGGGGGYDHHSNNMSNGGGGGGYGPPPSDLSMGGPYMNYGGPPQDAYYQNTGYSQGPPQYAGQNQQNQGYRNYNEGSADPAGYNQGYDAGRRPPRKDKDDKAHDSIIEERIQRERPCRTLFIRNIKASELPTERIDSLTSMQYETDSDEVYRQFQEHGDIKTFFDLISTRGMVFVTYFDLRSAERARDRLQGSEISGRPIDVHYSLPRDDQNKSERERSQELQGCLQVTLRSSVSNLPIDDNEVRIKFQQFGDVKAVKPVDNRSDSRYVEYYDMRACDEAFNRLRHQGLQDGVMDIVYAWDTTDTSSPHGAEDRGGRGGRGAPRGRGRGRGRGGGGGYDEGGGRRPRDDDYGRGGRGGYGPRGGYSNDRFDNRNSYGSGYNPPPSSGGGGYETGGYGPPGAGAGPGAFSPPAGPADDRLEQARKVQALLAALKPAEAAPPVGPPLGAQPPLGLPPPGMQAPYYAGPPAPQIAPYPPPSAGPPSNSYGMPPPPVAPQLNPALSALPPNLLALLQQAQANNQQSQFPGAAVTPPPGAMPPMNSQSPPPAANPQQYQQMLLYQLRQAAANGKPPPS
ncbi:unnamed protein product [Mycena citricolor]|uniref:RRM domain-containing protein n=1 Tax=Mycena citricolor TaxID=2018698 RepID=A0AAD2HSP3_9AGAR|nr:unnamed protein product [Mycena citricolor]